MSWTSEGVHTGGAANRGSDPVCHLVADVFADVTKEIPRRVARNFLLYSFGL